MRWILVILLVVLTLACSKPATFEQVDTMPPGVARTQAYIELAERGDYRAQVRLGGLFRKDDPVKSAKYFRLASDAGDIDATYFLGVDYLDGTGVPQNQQEGIRILQIAAKAGSVPAMEKLGNIFATLSKKAGSKAYGVLAEQYYQSAFLHGSRVSASHLWGVFLTYPMADTYKSAMWSGVVSSFPNSVQKDSYALLAAKHDGIELVAKVKAEASDWFARFNSKPKVKTFLDLNGMYD